jgi:hypothetical protein
MSMHFPSSTWPNRCGDDPLGLVPAVRSRLDPFGIWRAKFASRRSEYRAFTAIGLTSAQVDAAMPVPSMLEALLGHWKVPFDSLPTGSVEQSDYLVKLGRSRFLIEEKTKFDDAEEEANRARQMEAKGRLIVVKPIVRRNRLSAIVRKAASQLESSGRRFAHHFRLVWFNSTGPYAKAHALQFRAGLYGKVGVTGLRLPAVVPCYFFGHSDFFNHADRVDGAIVVHPVQDGLEPWLCLNPLSHRYDSLRRTKLVRLFGRNIDDPLRAERERRAFILDCDIDRSDEAALLAYVERKYDTGPLMTFNIGYQQLAVRLRQH